MGFPHISLTLGFPWLPLKPETQRICRFEPGVPGQSLPRLFPISSLAGGSSGGSTSRDSWNRVSRANSPNRQNLRYQPRNMNLLLSDDYLLQDYPENITNTIRSGHSTCVRFNRKGDY